MTVSSPTPLALLSDYRRRECTLPRYICFSSPEDYSFGLFKIAVILINCLLNAFRASELKLWK